MVEGNKEFVKCLVCGAVFEKGTEVCPVCNVGPENFIPYERERGMYQNNSEEIFLILGNGVAGLSAAEAIRERNATCSVVMVTQEEWLTYSRPMLTKSMMGGLKAEELYLHDQAWYEEKNILTLTGKQAVSIDPAVKQVNFQDGTALKYDKCIYALGSSCFIPPIKGHEKPQVAAIRSVRDTEMIATLLPSIKQVAVIGGGVLGLEAAWELYKAGCQVSILELSPQLMGRQLDEEAGTFLKDMINAHNIQIHLNVKIEEIEGESSVTGVRLGDGTVIPAQLVIVSAGVRANVSVAQTAGVKIGRAVMVNEHMETSIPDLYACGDCAEYQGINYAIWPQAVEMGKVAGASAAGEAAAYRTVAAALTFNGMDTSLYAIGDPGKDPAKIYQSAKIQDAENGVYKAYYSENDKVCGAILIGDTSDMQRVTQVVVEG